MSDGRLTYTIESYRQNPTVDFATQGWFSISLLHLRFDVCPNALKLSPNQAPRVRKGVVYGARNVVIASI